MQKDTLATLYSCDLRPQVGKGVFSSTGPELTTLGPWIVSSLVTKGTNPTVSCQDMEEEGCQNMEKGDNCSWIR